jgi:Fic family protein
MIAYNPEFLENVNIFTSEEKKQLKELNKRVSLSKFLSNESYVEKFGMDFIHTSSKIEGNTYDMNDTLTLLKYGRTAGGKKYSDAKMILNMRDAYYVIIKDSLYPNKQTLKNLHYILSDGMVAEHERGTPRDEQVLIGGSQYIPLATKEKLDDELNYLFNQYEKIEDSFDRAIYLHCNLAYLQYFKDCNKRTARIMLNVSLKNDDKLLYIPNEERIAEYSDSIVTYYETGSYDKFKHYFISEYKTTVEAIEEVEKLKEKEKNQPLRNRYIGSDFNDFLKEEQIYQTPKDLAKKNKTRKKR